MPDIEEFANKYFFQSEKQIEFVCLSSFGYWNSSFSELRKRAREFRHHVNETRALELNFRGILVQSCLKFQQFYLVTFDFFFEFQLWPKIPRKLAFFPLWKNYEIWKKSSVTFWGKDKSVALSLCYFHSSLVFTGHSVLNWR